jgi:GGDEF domain-containing protein
VPLVRYSGDVVGAAGAQTFTDAIRRADAAMDRAKAAGRDRLDVHVDAAS